MDDHALTQRLDALRPLGEAICSALCREIDRLGFPPGRVSRYPDFERAAYRTVKDPYSGAEDVAGDWLDGGTRRLGSIQFHADGTFYAEFDVVLPHPRDTRWFVEGVTAWGRGEVIKSEPKLLPAPG